jgi:hypothetical protein
MRHAHVWRIDFKNRRKEVQFFTKTGHQQKFEAFGENFKFLNTLF